MAESLVQRAVDGKADRSQTNNYFKEMHMKKGFSSRLGFILAAAGSAVGLGNIWRFPYLAAKYGGGIFLLVYLVLAVTFGFALMVTQIALGRRTGKSSIEAYRDLDKRFGFIGYLETLVPMVIFPYYCVIGGWVVKFLGVYTMGEGHEATGESYFGSFIGETGGPIICLSIFLFLTALVVILGVDKGIERVSKFMMPVLVVMSVGIAVYCLTLDGAMKGVEYYLKPDFSHFSFKTVVAAMGQLFYSMSLAMGIMVTYGSYMNKEDDLERAVRHIEVFDTGIAFLAGLMIIPAVFAFSGGDSEALQKGPTLMFVTLPKVFDSIPGGHVIGFAFFVLVLFAALTSAISLMETIVSVFVDKTNIKREWICIGVMIFSFIIAIPSSLGFGIWSNITIFGMSILDFFDYISNNILMPIVALFLALFVGFVTGPDVIINEVESSGNFKSKGMFRVIIKYVVPVCMVIILISSVFQYV